MADALAVAGLGLGVASLLLQVTDECIKRYHYFVEASRMPESFRYLRVRLQMEQQRFLSFALEAGLLHKDGTLCESLQLNHAILQAVLNEIRNVMEAYEETQRKYSEEVPFSEIDWDDRGEPRTDLMDLLTLDRRGAGDVPSENSSPLPSPTTARSRTLAALIGAQATAKIRKLRVILTDRKRLSWVAKDKGSLEELVSKLRSLNTFLISRLDSSQITRLEKAVEDSYMEMLQLRGDIRNLQVLVRALDVDAKIPHQPEPLLAVQPDAHSEEEAWNERAFRSENSDQDRRVHLRALTAIKLSRLGIEKAEHKHDALIMNEASALLDLKSLFGRSFYQWPRRAVPPERVVLEAGDCYAWVEWMDTPDPRLSTTRNVPLAETRIARLASLLRRKLPSGFLSPRCLGYCRSEIPGHGCNFGLVFQAPSSRPTNLTSLRDTLGERPKPSLSIRISLSSLLAECLRTFHSVDWLHKGFRSENVLFLSDHVDDIDFMAPCVTGFELSRPNEDIEMTIQPKKDLLRDLYRHPHVQSQEEYTPYRKMYDLYSLGVLLLEIINWRPIEDILQLWPSTISRQTVQGVKCQLLGERLGCGPRTKTGLALSAESPYLAKVGEKGGDVLRSVIETCLTADEFDQPTQEGNEVTHNIQPPLSAIVEAHIIEPLRAMREVV